MTKSPELFSESARIDIATNFASFDAIDFSSDFPDFIDGDLKIGHFLTLIHEATHHWCLMTPVGTALAARTYRTYHDAAYMAASIPAATPTEHDRRAPFDASLFASRALTNFFVPLLEGLALYAEWRACPDGTGVYSRPFDLLDQFSGTRTPSEQSREYLDRLSRELELAGADQINALLQVYANSPEMRHLSYEGGLSFAMGLRQLRIIPSERARFERIFQSAIDPRDGSYQLGYLFVCAIETLSHSHGRSDMLLGFLRDYFFNDPILAALILDEDTGVVELYNQVSVYFSERVVALTSNPESTARQVEAWGTTVPFAPVARSSADDFLGRTPSDEADPATELYAKKLRAFCTSVGSEVVPGEVLETFLVLGRALMPLGSDNFEVTAVGDGLVHMSTDKGLEISVNTADFHSTPVPGTRIRAKMLANVMSPGTIVSFQWGEQFEIIAPGHDSISKPIVEVAYHHAEQIREVVQIGQEAIEHIQRQTPYGLERIEAVADEYLESDEATNHVIQIYRFPIVMAFTADIPKSMDARWRTSAFRAWQPRGVSTLLNSPALLRDFLKICGMTVALHIGREDLNELDLVQSPDDLDHIDAELFALFRGITRKDYQSIIAAVQLKFESQGIRLFGQTQGGEWLSLI